MLSETDDFAEMELRAIALLEHAERAEPRDAVRGYRPTLRLWDHPAFGQRRTWTVFVADGQFLAIVRQVTWDRRADVTMASDPVAQLYWHFGQEPTVSVEDGTLLRSELAERLDALRRLRLPARRHDELYGLDGGAALPCLDPQWWCDRPGDWRELNEWFAAMRELLIGAISPI